MSRRPNPGAVIMLPFDASGLAPSISRYDVRSMSGTATINWCPYSRYDASMCGSWSIDVALNRFRVRSCRTIVGMWVSAPRLCTFGLPR